MLRRLPARVLTFRRWANVLRNRAGARPLMESVNWSPFSAAHSISDGQIGTRPFAVAITGGEPDVAADDGAHDRPPFEDLDVRYGPGLLARADETLARRQSDRDFAHLHAAGQPGDHHAHQQAAEIRQSPMRANPVHGASLSRRSKMFESGHEALRCGAPVGSANSAAAPPFNQGARTWGRGSV